MREIVLTQGKVALVDDEDYEWLMQWNWYAWWSGSRWYVRRSVSSNGLKRYMHREIIGAETGEKVDHWDGSGLNNQRYNLRLCTSALNNANKVVCSVNTSGFKGVTWDSERGKWVAQAHSNGKHIFLGRFENKIEAAEAYDAEALERWGAFALTNAAMGLL